jgi:hypothetical protein
MKLVHSLIILLTALVSIGLGLAGCFTSPTSPSWLSDSGISPVGDDPTAVPTYAATPGNTVGTGVIGGLISGSNGEFVTITATGGSGLYIASRTGDGSYHITGLPAGTYIVVAESASYYGYYSGNVSVTEGQTTSNIHITMF